jgi:hypothetical protein
MVQELSDANALRWCAVKSGPVSIIVLGVIFIFTLARLFDLRLMLCGFGREPGEHFLIPAKVVVLLFAHCPHRPTDEFFKLSLFDLFH